MFSKHPSRRTPTSVEPKPPFVSVGLCRTSTQGGKAVSGSPVLRDSPAAILNAAHVEVEEHLARYGTLGPEENREKNRLSQQIREELLIVLEVEESLFYPALRRLDAELTRQAVAKAQQNHAELKFLLKELTELRSENRSLDVKMDALRQCVLRHFQLEASQMFPPSRTLPLKTLRELSSRMELIGDRLRMNQQRTRQSEDERNMFYPTLQDQNGFPEDDRGTARSLESPSDVHERHPSDFENWGSE